MSTNLVSDAMFFFANAVQWNLNPLSPSLCMNRETPPGCHHINVTKHWNVINTTHSFISRNCILFWGKLWLIAAQIISCSDQNLDLRGVKSHVPDVFPMLLCRQRAASSLLQSSELSHEHYHPVIYTKIDALQDSISQEKKRWLSRWHEANTYILFGNHSGLKTNEYLAYWNLVYWSIFVLKFQNEHL